MSDEQQDIPLNDMSQSVAATNLKALGDGPAMYQNMAYANAVANQQASQAVALGHQQALNQIAQAATGKIVESIIATSPSEGASEIMNLGQLLKALNLPTTPTV